MKIKDKEIRSLESQLRKSQEKLSSLSVSRLSQESIRLAKNNKSTVSLRPLAAAKIINLIFFFLDFTTPMATWNRADFLSATLPPHAPRRSQQTGPVRNKQAQEKMNIFCFLPRFTIVCLCRARRKRNANERLPVGTRRKYLCVN